MEIGHGGTGCRIEVEFPECVSGSPKESNFRDSNPGEWLFTALPLFGRTQSTRSTCYIRGIQSSFGANHETKHRDRIRWKIKYDVAQTRLLIGRRLYYYCSARHSVRVSNLTVTTKTNPTFVRPAD